MKNKIVFIILAIIILLSSCSLFKPSLDDDLLMKIDSVVRHTIDNIDSIKQLDHPFYCDDFEIYYRSADFLEEFFKNKDYRICLIEEDSQYINSENKMIYIVYSIPKSDAKIRVDYNKYNKQSEERIVFYFSLEKTCKFWKWKNEGQPFTGDTE